MLPLSLFAHAESKKFQGTNLQLPGKVGADLENDENSGHDSEISSKWMLAVGMSSQLNRALSATSKVTEYESGTQPSIYSGGSRV